MRPKLGAWRTSIKSGVAAAVLAVVLVAGVSVASALSGHSPQHLPKRPETTKRDWCGHGPDCRVSRSSARAFLHHRHARASARAQSSRIRPRVHAHAASAGTYPETTGGSEPSHTWTNYTNAGGEEGHTINVNETVQIACRVKGFKVEDGDEWWYLIAQSPWSYGYYVSADAFYG